jgi:hypothetical protein
LCGENKVQSVLDVGHTGSETSKGDAGNPWAYLNSGIPSVPSGRGDGKGRPRSPT